MYLIAPNTEDCDQAPSPQSQPPHMSHLHTCPISIQAHFHTSKQTVFVRLAFSSVCSDIIFLEVALGHRLRI